LQRRSLVKKAQKIKEVIDLVKRYQVIGISALHKVRASQLQEIRKKLAGTATLQVIKNSLVEKAVLECKDKPNIEMIKEHLKGSNLFIFTDLNPFKLALLLEKSKVKDFAKAGDIATEYIILPAGNTGLSPGPVISQLGSVGIPTRIESGSVWVSRDTIVAKKGEVISESLAPILSKLGIKAVEMGLTIKAVYDGGAILTENELKLNLDEYKEKIGEVYAEALKLSLNAAYPTDENIQMLIQVAFTEAYSLALKAGIPTRETIRDLIKKAHFEALALSSRISA
jgi:large subunit ribosomal protein L10